MAPTPMPYDPLLERLRQATHGLYEIRDELGRGGMAVVYMAKDLRLHRPVAIKVMQPALLHAEGMTDRFLQEARIAAQLQHPNIIIVHDVQQQNDLLYFVMNLVEGATIDEMMRASPFTIAQVRWILSSAARGLAHAHSEGVVHRDVKPGNLLVNVKGDVIVTDFGIAKGVDSVRMTQTGMAIGTPVYMSPEQVTGTSGLSSASDQYSLGIAAYEMLAGTPPFTGDNAFALQVAHVQREPADVISKRPDCPPDLAFIVHRMISKSPEQRWSSLEEVSALASAALPFGGGDARKELAATARRIHDGRGLSTAAFGVRTPRSPMPRPSVPREERTSGSVTSLVLKPPQSHLSISGKIRLHSLAVVNGQDSGEHRAKWMSTDPRVAVVTDEGEVLGIGAGRAEIIAVNQFGEARATIEVVNTPESSIALLDTPVPVSVASTSVPMAVVDTPVPVAKVDTPAPVIHVMTVDLTPARAVMEGGEVIPLTVKVRDMRGAIVTDPIVEWHSDAPLVAWVDDRGTVAALASGRATITATVDGVTARTTIEVGSTWKTVNSLEQLAVHRPTPVPVALPETPNVAPAVPTPSDATPTPAALPVEPLLIDALVAPKSASPRNTTVEALADAPTGARVGVGAPAEKAAAVESAKPKSTLPSRMLVGGGVALLAIVATIWALKSPSDTDSALAGDSSIVVVNTQGGDSLKQVASIGDSLSRDSLTRDSLTRDSVARNSGKRDSVIRRTAFVRDSLRRDSISKRAGARSDSAARAIAAKDSARRVAVTRDSAGRAIAARDSARRVAAARDSAARAAAVRDSTIRAATVRDSVARATASRDSAARVAAGREGTGREASIASAVRDLRAQLQQKAVTVGPLESFFKLGKDHEANTIGAAHDISTASGSLTATIEVEVKRTGPSGNIERRRSQVTFRVVGSGGSATAQAINASSLQRPP